MCIQEEKKVKLKAYKLKGGASAWWERLKLSRSREGKLLMTSWPKMKRLLKARFLPPNDYGIQREPFQCSYGDRFVGCGVSNNHQVQHHLYKSPNRPFAYEEKFVYVEDVQLVTRVEMLSKKKYVQPLPLFPVTTSMEESLPPPSSKEQPPLPQEQSPPPKERPPPPKEKPLPPQVQSSPPSMQLITFTTKGDDSYEENNEVEEDNNEEDDNERTNGEILLEVEGKEKSSLGEIYTDFSKSNST
jgi:hypothetical protein